MVGGLNSMVLGVSVFVFFFSFFFIILFSLCFVSGADGKWTCKVFE